MAIGGIPPGGSGTGGSGTGGTGPSLAEILAGLKSGDVITARVVQAVAGGVRLQIGRALVEVATSVPLKPGSVVSLQVERSTGAVALRVLPQPQPQPGAQQTPAPPPVQTQAPAQASPQPKSPPPAVQPAPSGAAATANPAQPASQTPAGPVRGEAAPQPQTQGAGPPPAASAAQTPDRPAAQPGPQASAVVRAAPQTGGAPNAPTPLAPAPAAQPPQTGAPPATGQNVTAARAAPDPAAPPPAQPAPATPAAPAGRAASPAAAAASSQTPAATGPEPSATTAFRPTASPAPVAATRAQAPPAQGNPAPATAPQAPAPQAQAQAGEPVSPVLRAQTVATARAQALPEQAGLAPLYANLAAVAAEPAAARAQPAVEAAVRHLLGLRTAPESLTDPQRLAGALRAGGTFLEAALARGLKPPEGDLKAALLTLRTVLAKVLGETGQPMPARTSHDLPPPERGSAPQAQRPVLPSLPGGDGAEALRHLAAQTDGALARLRLLQIASLPDADGSPRRDGPADQQPRTWQMELPIGDGRETRVMGLRVERDRRSRKDAREGTVWRVRLALDLGEAGPVSAAIAYAPPQVSVVLWAEQPDTSQVLKDHAGLLDDALRAAELDVEGIDVQTGRAPAQARASEARPAGGLVDREG